jgi:hypothetical protein
MYAATVIVIYLRFFSQLTITNPDWPAQPAGYDWEVSLAIGISPDNTLVIGQTVLSSFYTVFDMANNQVGFAPATAACYYGSPPP